MTMRTAHQTTAAEAALGAHLPRGGVASALARFGLPGRRHEAWRWSDLRTTLHADHLEGARRPNRDAPEINPPAPVSGITGAGPEVHPGSPEMALMGGVPLLLLDGAPALDGAQATPFVAPRGMAVWQQRRVTAEENIPDINILDTNTPDAGALVPALARQMAPSITGLRVSAKISAPLVIRHRASRKGPVASHLDIELEAGAQAIIVEVIDPQEAGFANRYTKITLGEGAQVTRILVQSESPEAVIIHHTDVTVRKDASFRQTVLGFGAKLARLETYLVHEAPGAAAALDGAYLITDNCHLDMTSRVDHAVPGCTTTQLVKGVAGGAARGVFQGKFFVARDAQRTDAQMGHHGLMLSPDAELRAKPELEIHADDVACAHGNTAGALDENALFYLQQRGLTAAAAKALLVDAFLGEVFEALPDGEIQRALARLAARAMKAAL